MPILSYLFLTCERFHNKDKNFLIIYRKSDKEEKHRKCTPIYVMITDGDEK